VLGDSDLRAALGVGRGAERAQRLLDDLRFDAVAGDGREIERHPLMLSPRSEVLT
jgi:hypothetical protein